MNRRTKIFLTALLGVALAQPGSLPACTVCYGGGSDSALGQGMGWGIFALLCTVLTVLAGIALFFVHVVRREAALSADSARVANFQRLIMEKLFKDLMNMPVLASENGKDVDDLIIYIHLLMVALFVGWFGYFIYALWKFRRARQPKADYVGIRNHASNYIEGIVALVEAALLIFVAIPVYARAVDKKPSESESTVIQVVAQQFDWNFRYPGKDGTFGKQEMRLVNEQNIFGVDPTDSAGKDDAQTTTQMHVVVNKPVIAYISSRDVIHSFKLIALRMTQDAIPGMRIPIWFKPTQVGTYQINCAQLCGGGHSSMSRGLLVVDTQEDFDKWLATKTGAPQFNPE